MGEISVLKNDLISKHPYNGGDKVNSLLEYSLLSYIDFFSFEVKKVKFFRISCLAVTCFLAYYLFLEICSLCELSSFPVRHHHLGGSFARGSALGICAYWSLKIRGLCSRQLPWVDCSVPKVTLKGNDNGTEKFLQLPFEKLASCGASHIKLTLCHVP